LVRDFIAAHDWKTLKDTLSYLKHLGVNAIEIMPFNEFEGNESWGYNSDFYFAPDKYYGPAQRLKEFIDSCHKNGFAVIMDIVLNHTYGPSPLAMLYWDRQNNRPAANNPWYNPVQPHAFGFGDDFNHSSAATKQFFNRVLQYWVSEYKIDGYRVDFSKGLTQTPSTNDAQFSAYDISRINILKGYYDVIKQVDANAIVILEHFAANNEEIELSDYGMLLWGNHNHNYSLAAMAKPSDGFSTWNFEGVIHSVRGWSKPHLVGYMESHDEERLMRRTLTEGNSSGSYNTSDTTTALKRMGLDAAFFLTIPGPKMIWQFGEMGYDYSINHCPDGTISNDCRTSNKPIRWDYLQDPRRKELFDVYSKLIKLRFHTWYKDLFQTGTTERNLANDFKWLKMNSGDSSRIVVVGNFGLAPNTFAISFPTAGTWYDYLANTTFTTTGSTQNIALLPGEYRVFVNRNVNNTATTPVINIPSQANAFIAKVYPNPVQSSYVLEMQLPVAGQVSVDLLNPLGQKLKTVYNGFLPRGNQRINLLRQPSFNAGSYYLRIHTKTTSELLQIIYQ
ncbi:MAG TPA: alpha-amylase family glycosyl hydrolase, partial [Chitinophagaceae bacterium]